MRGTWLALIGATLMLAGCGKSLGESGSGSSGSGSSGFETSTREAAAGKSTPSHNAWTGFGAKLADWETAHPKQTGGCPAGTCFGEPLAIGGETRYQFQLLTTGPETRVEGYEQSFGAGTTVAAAKAEVLRLMPRDTGTVSFSVQHTASGSCAFWNLRSRTLGRYLSAAGTVGIEFSNASPSGQWAYSPGDVHSATVGTAPLTSGSEC
jgi:hypothetical protein